jgi:hypothetical protein
METSVVGKRAAKAHGPRRCFSVWHASATQLDHQTRKWNQIDSPRHVRIGYMCMHMNLNNLCTSIYIESGLKKNTCG